MKMTQNTILVTGGGSGIGRALAESFHALGNKVIIAGRQKQRLEETIAANPGMHFRILDQSNASRICDFARQLMVDFPDLDALVNNAGIQHMEDLTSGVVAEAEATVMTDLLGPIRLTAALLPFLMRKAQATVLNVSSSLGFVPMAVIPTYCASKAAMHSYTQSLRYQLRKTSVQVIEIIPPGVQTGLRGNRTMDPEAMPLDEFTSETMSILKNSPDATENVVERAKPRRFAEANGGYDTFFRSLNEQVAAAQGKEA